MYCEGCYMGNWFDEWFEIFMDLNEEVWDYVVFESKYLFIVL